MQHVPSFSKCAFIFKMSFHFQNVLPLSKYAFIFQNMISFLECAFIFKMCFHFQNVFSFSKCHDESCSFQACKTPRKWLIGYLNVNKMHRINLECTPYLLLCPFSLNWQKLIYYTYRKVASSNMFQMMRTVPSKCVKHRESG